jgi:hypothetical protein
MNIQEGQPFIRTTPIPTPKPIEKAAGSLFEKRAVREVHCPPTPPSSLVSYVQNARTPSIQQQSHPASSEELKASLSQVALRSGKLPSPSPEKRMLPPILKKPRTESAASPISPRPLLSSDGSSSAASLASGFVTPWDREKERLAQQQAESIDKKKKKRTSFVASTAGSSRSRRPPLARRKSSQSSASNTPTIRSPTVQSPTVRSPSVRSPVILSPRILSSAEITSLSSSIQPSSSKVSAVPSKSDLASTSVTPGQISKRLSMIGTQQSDDHAGAGLRRNKSEMAKLASETAANTNANKRDIRSSKSSVQGGQQGQGIGLGIGGGRVSQFTEAFTSPSPKSNGNALVQDGDEKGGTDIPKAPAQDNWLVDRDFRRKFVDKRKQERLASMQSSPDLKPTQERTKSRSGSTVAFASNTTFVKIPVAGSSRGKGGKNFFLLDDTDNEEPLKSPGPDAGTAIEDDGFDDYDDDDDADADDNEENDDELEQPLPRTKSQITLMLERERRMSEGATRREKKEKEKGKQRKTSN